MPPCCTEVLQQVSMILCKIDPAIRRHLGMPPYGAPYNAKRPLAPSGRHPKGVPLAELSPQTTEGLKM